MSKSEVHASTFGSLVRAVSWVLGNLSETRIHFSDDFELEKALTRVSFNVGWFAFVVPQENLGQVVTGVVNVVWTDPTTRLRMLKSYNLTAFNNLIVTVIFKWPVRSDCEIWAQWRCVNFVKSSKLVYKHASVNHRSDYVFEIFWLFHRIFRLDWSPLFWVDLDSLFRHQNLLGRDV